jgi:hypothetical protein
MLKVICVSDFLGRLSSAQPMATTTVAKKPIFLLTKDSILQAMDAGEMKMVFIELPDALMM